MLLGVSRSAAQSRLRALAENGYVERRQIFSGQPACCRIMRPGLGAIGSDLRPPRVDLAGYQHDIGLGWLWLAAKAGAFGPVEGLSSERSMRSLDARRGTDGPRFGVGLGAGGRDGVQQLHYPDLLLKTDGKLVAVELELSPKGRGRLDQIMLGYAGEPRIDAVLYLVRDRGLGRRIETAARKHGISGLVHIQLVAGAPAGAPDLGAGAGRRPRQQTSDRSAER